MTEREKNLESKEIRGITPRLIYWIVGSTVTICSVVLGCYFGLVIQITKIQDHAGQQDDKIEINRINLNGLSLKYDDLNVRTYKLENKKN